MLLCRLVFGKWAEKEEEKWHVGKRSRKSYSFPKIV